MIKDQNKNIPVLKFGYIYLYNTSMYLFQYIIYVYINIHLLFK